MTNREIFKAGMIHMLRVTHLELTGSPYTAPVNWDERDEASLKYGMGEAGIPYDKELI